jgi:hypothetical protein
MSDEPKTCLTDGSEVTPDHREIDPASGMQKGYVVLCPEERAKGFVRPVRRSYKHAGRSVCGKMRSMENEPEYRRILGGPRFVCVGQIGHSGKCVSWTQVTQPEHAEISGGIKIGGCGAITTMSLALAETYARDPKFYSGTYCVGCRTHFPVAEFTWDPDGSVVGS